MTDHDSTDAAGPKKPQQPHPNLQQASDAGLPKPEDYEEGATSDADSDDEPATEA